MLKNFLRDEDGQGMVEYALIIGLIAIAVLVVLGALGGVINAKFTEIKTGLESAGKN